MASISGKSTDLWENLVGLNEPLKLIPGLVFVLQISPFFQKLNIFVLMKLEASIFLKLFSNLVMDYTLTNLFMPVGTLHIFYTRKLLSTCATTLLNFSKIEDEIFLLFS